MLEESNPAPAAASEAAPVDPATEEAPPRKFPEKSREVRQPGEIEAQGAAAVKGPADDDCLSDESQISTLQGLMRAMRQRDLRRERHAAAAAAADEPRA